MACGWKPSCHSPSSPRVRRARCVGVLQPVQDRLSAVVFEALMNLARGETLEIPHHFLELLAGGGDQVDVIRHDDQPEELQGFVLTAVAQAVEDGIDIARFDKYRQPVEDRDRAEVGQILVRFVAGHGVTLQRGGSCGKGFPRVGVRERILALATAGRGARKDSRTSNRGSGCEKGFSHQRPRTFPEPETPNSAIRLSQPGNVSRRPCRARNGKPAESRFRRTLPTCLSYQVMLYLLGMPG